VAKKSRRKKRFSQVKRDKLGPVSTVTPREQQEVTQIPEPPSQPKVAAVSASPAGTRYPYITTELRAIFILAGIILVALVVLRFFLL